MVTSKICHNRPTVRLWPAEDRLRPVPMAPIGSGLRRERRGGRYAVNHLMHLNTRFRRIALPDARCSAPAMTRAISRGFARHP